MERFLSAAILFCLLAGGSTEGSTHTLPFRVPSVRRNRTDQYVCTGMPIATNQTSFLVGFEPSARSNAVHHMMLFGCAEPGSDAATWSCPEMSSSSDFSAHPCKSNPQILYVWAHHAPMLTLPENVGFKVGLGSDVRHLVLQVHYAEVQQFDDGESDDSGIILHATDASLPRQAGVLQMGTLGRILPHSVERMQTACQLNEGTNIHPFAFRVHTHALGRSVSGYVVRRNAEGTDDWLLLGQQDPQNPQMFYPILANITVVNGDFIAAQCIMVSNRDRVTVIGDSHTDEMCNFYVMYWAERSLRLQRCFSSGAPGYYWRKDFNTLPAEGVRIRNDATRAAHHR